MMIIFIYQTAFIVKWEGNVEWERICWQKIIAYSTIILIFI